MKKCLLLSLLSVVFLFAEARSKKQLSSEVKLLPYNKTATSSAFKYKFCNGEPIPFTATATFTATGPEIEGSCEAYQVVAVECATAAADTAALLDQYQCSEA